MRNALFSIFYTYTERTQAVHKEYVHCGICRVTLWGKKLSLFDAKKGVVSAFSRLGVALEAAKACYTALDFGKFEPV